MPKPSARTLLPPGRTRQAAAGASRIGSLFVAVLVAVLLAAGIGMCAPAAAQTTDPARALLQPGEPGLADGRFRLQIEFDRLGGDAAADPLAVRLRSTCGTLDIQLNGTLIHRDAVGSISDHLCPQPRLIALPTPLLREHGNQLELDLHGLPLSQVTHVRRATYLGQVQLGALPALATQHARAEFSLVGLPWLTQFGLVLLAGAILLLSATARHGRRMRLYGLLALAWSGGPILVGFQHQLLSAAWSDLLLASLWAPITALAIEFMLSFCGRRYHWLRRLLIVQALLLPAGLLLLPLEARFAWASAWACWLAVQGLAVFAVFLRVSWNWRRGDFWWTLASLGVAALASIYDSSSAPPGLPWPIGLSWLAASPLGWATLLTVIGLRLLCAYREEVAARQLQRSPPPLRQHASKAAVQHNLAQLTQMRLEQLTEKERRQIAADLHDDLGAKLLTIVHTCESERIATLGREALDEMRLSVRGLSGKPFVFGDAFADWRAELVSRLRLADIRVEWQGSGDAAQQLLAARTYVQTTRILREAVSNIIRHSNASRCRVNCSADSAGYGIVIEDNGDGIANPTETNAVPGHGISTMKHRAREMGGRCDVESESGHGTVVRLSLPWRLPSGD